MKSSPLGPSIVSPPSTSEPSDETLSGGNGDDELDGDIVDGDQAAHGGRVASRGDAPGFRPRRTRKNRACA